MKGPLFSRGVGSMLMIRPALARGRTTTDWLDSWHTFSFGDYLDESQRGFRALRVINEDRIAPGRGFGMHGHRDMEILTFMLSGQLEHRDDMGNRLLLTRGQVQRMSAGSGIRHSEFNAATNETAHLYQVWIVPGRRGLPPGYEQRSFALSPAQDGWRLVASPQGRLDSLTIHQDALVMLAELDSDQCATHPLAAGRHAWLQVAAGAVEANGVALGAGDGAAISAEQEVVVRARRPAEIMLFDLP